MGAGRRCLCVSEPLVKLPVPDSVQDRSCRCTPDSLQMFPSPQLSDGQDRLGGDLLNFATSELPVGAQPVDLQVL